MTAGARTLILLRHGKSGYPAGVPDHDRPLADRDVGIAEKALRHRADALGFEQYRLHIVFCK